MKTSSVAGTFETHVNGTTTGEFHETGMVTTDGTETYDEVGITITFVAGIVTITLSGTENGTTV